MFNSAAHNFVCDKISMIGTFAICNLRHFAEQIILVRICFSYKIFQIRIKNRHRWTTSSKTLQDIGLNIHVNGQIIFLKFFLSFTMNYKALQLVITEKILFQASENYHNNCKKKKNQNSFNLQSSITTCSDQNLIQYV